MDKMEKAPRIFIYVTSNFKINSFHQFSFHKFDIEGKQCSPGTLFAQNLSTSSNWFLFNLKKKNNEFSSRSIPLTESLFSMFFDDIINLEEIMVEKNQTKKQYLENNVCDKYYKGNEEFKTRYFSW